MCLRIFKRKKANVVSSTRKVSILGDSISTFIHYIPVGNKPYYRGKKCNVRNVNETWWKQLLTEKHMELLINNSWSGSCVSGSDISSATTKRCISLDKDGIHPNLIIIYMGINDFNKNVPLGTFDISTLPVHNDTFRESYSLLLYKITQKYKNAKVYTCTLFNAGHLAGGKMQLENENGNTIPDFNDTITEISAVYHVEVIDFYSCGINFTNLDQYTGDFNKITGKGLHPNVAGHKLLYLKAAEVVK